MNALRCSQSKKHNVFLVLITIVCSNVELQIKKHVLGSFHDKMVTYQGRSLHVVYMIDLPLSCLSIGNA